MILTIENLRAAGAFTGAPVAKEITWTQGGEELTALVYVRKLSYRSAVNDLTAMRGEGDMVAGRIASSICDEAGKPVFTMGDITGDADPERGALNNELTMALLAAIVEVNGLGKKTPT